MVSSRIKLDETFARSAGVNSHAKFIVQDADYIMVGRKIVVGGLFFLRVKTGFVMTRDVIAWPHAAQR